MLLLEDRNGLNRHLGRAATLEHHIGVGIDEVATDGATQQRSSAVVPVIRERVPQVMLLHELGLASGAPELSVERREAPGLWSNYIFIPFNQLLRQLRVQLFEHAHR